MLRANARRVQNLTPTEIWLFLLGRVLVAFAAGVFVTEYFPQIAAPIAIPTFVIGAVLFAIAAKGLWRKAPTKESAPL